MSAEKAFCRTDDLAIGYGKTPLMEHICLGAEKGSILTLLGPSRHWRPSWPRRGAQSCWTERALRTTPALSAPGRWP